MEQEYHETPCSNSNCDKILRLKISESDYGKMKTVACPVCGAQHQTKIPFNRKRVSRILKELDQTLLSVLKKGDEEILGFVQRLHNAGVHVEIALARCIIDAPDEMMNSAEVEPQVVNGEVKEDVFSESDEKMLKKLKIKL